MRVIVIGGGLIGLTSAYMLASCGWEVTVLERREGPGQETSFANGAVLTPSMPEPWNAPGSWKMLARSLGRVDSPLQLRLKALPGLVAWGSTFLRNSSPRRYERNALSNMSLARHSMKILERIRAETGMEYGRAAGGALRVFRDRSMLDRAVAWAERLRASGLLFRRLSTEEVIALEPALAPIASELTGAIHYPEDEVGNAYKFCLAITDHARRRGVAFRFHTPISALEVDKGRVIAAASGKHRFVADHYVLAAGSYSPRLLRALGFRLPVQPAKGYSITLDRSAETPLLGMPVADDELHAVVVPLEKAIRVAGTAEFAGFDLSLPEARLRNLLTLVRRVLPQFEFDPAVLQPWCGLRPLSADGVPIIGRAPPDNLWINTGHGHLGWTLAAGSAQLLSDLMRGMPPKVDAKPFAPARFRRS